MVTLCDVSLKLLIYKQAFIDQLNSYNCIREILYHWDGRSESGSNFSNLYFKGQTHPSNI
jgi:hypothetical protein